MDGVNFYNLSLNYICMPGYYLSVYIPVKKCSKKYHVSEKLKYFHFSNFFSKFDNYENCPEYNINFLKIRYYIQKRSYIVMKIHYTLISIRNLSKSESEIIISWVHFLLYYTRWQHTQASINFKLHGWEIPLKIVSSSPLLLPTFLRVIRD